ncbi:MAG: type II toxin-antitoxin system HicB family antitoxin [Gemmataceae bacterium]|nr:type II toxin-antitoxin system HicB family antitoxin [Gemmataceae bacterium]
MSIERKANYILEQARVLAPRVTTWADFSVALFDQRTGLVAKTFEDPMEREAFFDSQQYKEVNGILLKLMKKFGVANGATPKKSGRILVRVPRTVHTTLEVEAKKEGVSLNQLAVAKLALPLRERMDLSIPVIVEAYTRVHDGYSTDRVVVDPDLNARFLLLCRKAGLTQSDYQLNHALLDIRKSKKAKLPKATKRTEFRDYDEYQFAAEIATRILQRTEGVTLDRILCDPCIALQFDVIAKQLAPKQPVLKLRCAALNLRKTRRLGATKGERVPEYDLVPAGPLQALVIPELPGFPAAYALYDQTRPIFAGETEDLRQRVEMHLESGLPRWLGAEEGFDLVLKHSAEPAAKQEERRLWLGDFINKQRPLLNYQRVA